MHNIADLVKILPSQNTAPYARAFNELRKVNRRHPNCSTAALADKPVFTSTEGLSSYFVNKMSPNALYLHKTFGFVALQPIILHGLRFTNSLKTAVVKLDINRRIVNTIILKKRTNRYRFFLLIKLKVHSKVDLLAISFAILFMKVWVVHLEILKRIADAIAAIQTQRY